MMSQFRNNDEVEIWGEQNLKEAFDKISKVRNNMFRLDFEKLVYDLCIDFDNGHYRECLISSGNSAILAHQTILESIKDENR